MAILNLPLGNRKRKLISKTFLVFLVAFWLLFGINERAFRDLSENFLIGFTEKTDLYDFFFEVSGSETHTLSKNGSRFITLLFNLIYCGLCLLIIQLYFFNYTMTKVAVALYTSMVLGIFIINEGGKILDYEPFRIVAYRLMTMVVSPLPLILLISAMHLFIIKNK